MKLYFQAGERKRLLIDTDKQQYNTDYWYLGPHREYIKISVSDYFTILQELSNNDFAYEDKLR